MGRQGYGVLIGSDGGHPGGHLPGAGPTFNLLDFIDTWAYDVSIATVTAAECGPSPPETDVVIKFLGYFQGDGSDGSDWLPTPGDSIGLKFSYSSGVSAPINVRYTIADITMWAGECMNYPWAAASPVQSNTIKVPADINGSEYPFFDAWIGEPNLYDLRVYDIGHDATQYYADDILRHIPSYAQAIVPSKSVAAIVADIELDGPSANHTLWIRSRDYAMDCSVTPQASTGVGKSSNMQSLVTAFGDSVYNVTVPRDNDGIDTLLPGFATGDFMADAWEEDAFNVTDPTAIRLIQPFIDTTSTGMYPQSADDDMIPEGRDIDGDYLTNWEEYRGFYVSGDSTDYYDPDTTHRRTDPLTKTLFVHFHRILGGFVNPILPGYLYSWPEQEVYITKHFSDFNVFSQEHIEGINRTIDTNRVGSNLIYPPWLVPRQTGLPNYWHCNAVVYFFPTEFDSLSDLTLGKAAFYYQDFGNGREEAGIPNSASRITLNMNAINRIHGTSFYTNNDSLWDVDYPRILKNVISHELGHVIGMLHLSSPNAGLMLDSLRFQPSGRIILPDSVYVQNSKEEFTIKSGR